MKKLLLKNKFLTFIFLALVLGDINVGSAQNLWTGTTNNLFMEPTNWTTTPLFNGTDNLKISVATNNPVILDNSAATTPLINVVQFQTSAGTELTTKSDITSTSTSLSVYIGDKLHITAGTFWGKGNIYFGNNASEFPYCNIETGATLKVKAAILVGRNSSATIDVNGGTITGESTGALSLGNYTAAGPGIVNLNSGLIKLFKVSGLAVSTYGTLNVNGGKVEEPAGDLVVKGTLNVNGGLVNMLAGASTINNAGTTTGVINLNSGSITIGGLLNNITGTINVDGGSLILTGDQKTAMDVYIGTSVIKLSAAALTAGKILSNAYDSVTNLTTVMAVLPGVAPSALDYTTSAGDYTTGSAITANTVSAITLGTGAAAKYTVSPDLPTGLTIDANTGTISGTPTVVKALTTYYVKASTDYGFTTKAITIVTSAAPLGISDFKESAKIAVYPNPTTDSVTVSLSNNAAVQKISVYNNLGQFVRSENKNSVSLQDLAKGNYYLTIQTEEGSFSKKVIKN